MNRKISTVFVYCITFFLAACSSTPTPNLEATVQAAIAATEAARPTETPTPRPPDTPTPRPTNTSTVISTPIPDPTPDDLSVVEQATVPTTDLGDAVEQDGYTLSVVTFEDPTVPNTLYQAVEGQKLVAVEIVVGNVSGEQFTTNPASATLVDGEGFLHPPKLGSRDGQLALQALNPGEKIRGWIAFEIPSEAIVASIKYPAGSSPRIELEAEVPSASEVQPAVPTIEPTSSPTTAPPTPTAAPPATPTVALATPTNTPIPTPTQPPQAVCICSSDTYNCGDFATHARAQACFDYCRASGQGDIHRLDRDNDGLVCESLP